MRDPKSKYGERALYVLATNYYHQKDYQRMKTILRLYLKTFDSPRYEYYHETCFWLGWLMEQERKYRDACSYYVKATEEGLVVYRPVPPETVPDKDSLRKQLSNDTQFALQVPVSGEFKDTTLPQFLDFLHINTHLAIEVDAGVEGEGSFKPLTRAPFKNVPSFDLLHAGLSDAGLSVRGKNRDRSAAERAYYRLASVFKRDEQMDMALENCDLLLARFPETKRKKEIYALKLEIYKGLKRYADVLKTLELLRQVSGAEIEAYRYDVELAGIYYDLCHYEKAAELYKKALGAAKDQGEQLSIRERLGRALYRGGKLGDAFVHYNQLLKEETEPLARFVDQLMAFYLRFLLGQAQETEFPEEATRFVFAYERLSDDKRELLKKTDVAKACWVYYIKGLMELKKGRLEDGVKKLAAAGNAPDELLSGEANFQVGMAYWNNRASGREVLDKARESFEYLLFASKSTEAAVRGTFMLATCWRELGKKDESDKRFQQVMDQYPASPFAELAKKEREGGKAP
jgi:tetratricopeptide (TPR) repeat protein